MPTATSTDQYAITNLGPLTTVFTPPASCVTAAPSGPNLWLAVRNAFGDDRVAANYKKECGVASQGDCFPSGSQIDEAYSSATAKGISVAGTIDYFSPASACPDSYTTAGVASRVNGSVVSSSGIFVPPAVTVRNGGNIVQNPPLNVLMQVLDEGETAVICCPQNWTVGINGGCYSEVPASVYGERTACLRVRDNDDYTEVTGSITYNNTIMTGRIFSYTASSQAFSTRTTTLTASALTESMYPVASRAAVTMIHKGSVEETGGASGSGTAAPTETAPSAAHGMRMTTSGGNVGILATVWTFAALAGVALALPL
ncbi:hypothetical protein CkaCkLH20_04331 [Colletotrichum karsti]|uniref:Uncharacterized protein n=1 Tax=Colletotrichum karsti TaxID=1095194 RepID=A0A9P6LLY6_9PEZI|nr:uncharacterized protein CkaCkLH20_04331 [Colletotrichum karsti]KAF9878293.1 hypothetical protein CkaCkLH20_04331 [Colletotrichum karsti]